MKNWIKHIWKRESTAGTTWKTDDSILQFLQNHLDGKGNLAQAAHQLPDKEPYTQNNIAFAPGLMDALFGVDNTDEAHARSLELVNLVNRIARNGDPQSAYDFYQKVTTSEGVIGIIDDFLLSLLRQRTPIQPHLFAFAHDLAYKTNHRNSVKFGIALLGLCQDKSVIPALKIFALHDEFTIYSTVALSGLSDHLVTDLWELARKLKGWGKIRLVDKLATMELSDEIKDWLLREGYQNEIMYEYLAYTCAVKGDLRERIEAAHIDKNMFLSTGEIIDALITGGPAEDISDYGDAAMVVEQYIRHAAEHANDIASFVILHQINDFITGLQHEPEAIGKNGWTADIISNLLIEIHALLHDRDWLSQVDNALHSENAQTYWNGKLAAQRLGIDLWETVWNKLQTDPTDSTSWYDVTQHAKPGKTDEMVQFAIENLPIAILAAGPAEDAGIGPHFGLHNSLGFLLSFLEQHPGNGMPLVLTGLYSPVTRNRNLSIKILETWGRQYWTDEVSQRLLHLQRIEPNEETKANIEKLLADLK